MRKRTPKHPPLLVPLRYGEVYCELCRTTIRAGERVAWWKVLDYPSRDAPRRWRSRKAVYCRTCPQANIRAGRPLRSAA